jgi:hypothetical protein
MMFCAVLFVAFSLGLEMSVTAQVYMRLAASPSLSRLKRFVTVDGVDFNVNASLPDAFDVVVIIVDSVWLMASAEGLFLTDSQSWRCRDISNYDIHTAEEALYCTNCVFDWPNAVEVFRNNNSAVNGVSPDAYAITSTGGGGSGTYVMCRTARLGVVGGTTAAPTIPSVPAAHMSRKLARCVKFLFYARHRRLCRQYKSKFPNFN